MFYTVQALVQYPDGISATTAMTALEGHAIYDGGYNKVREPFFLKCQSCPEVFDVLVGFVVQAQILSCVPIFPTLWGSVVTRLVLLH